MHSIILKNISKKYRKNLQNFKSIIEYLLGIKSKDDFWVLNTIDLEVNMGETLGIIGRNGSGKSTLLKVIAGITFPNKGLRKVTGRIAPLIEVGAGFQPELTGRENIHFYGSVLNIKSSVLNDKIDEIVEFSGISHMIDTPVKFYSSGMLARLGFAITAYAEPDILIVDEVLAVGDTDFQNKCYQKIEELKIAGTTIIIVSHNMESIQNHCDKVIVLEEGSIIFNGTPSEAINIYIRKAQEDNFKYIPFNEQTNKLEVSDLKIKSADGELSINFAYKNPGHIQALWGLNVYTKNSVNLISSHGPKLIGSGFVSVDIKTEMLNNDSYFIEFAVLDTDPFVHYGNTNQNVFEITHNSKILPGVLNDTMLRWE